jgi:hypothetical protein
MLKKNFVIPVCDFKLELADTKYGYDVDFLTHINYNIT